MDKAITYFKNKGVNQNTLTMALTNIVSCVLFLLRQPYVASFYGHAMSKCCQYATNDLKVCGGMKEVSIKRFNLLFKRQLLGLKKRLRFVEMHIFTFEN